MRLDCAVIKISTATLNIITDRVDAEHERRRQPVSHDATHAWTEVGARQKL